MTCCRRKNLLSYLVISIFLFLSDDISLYANENTEPDIIRVILRDAINQQLLVNRDIVAIEIFEDGSKTWRARRTTNDKGVAFFNLSGMAQGRAFFFKTKAFSNDWVYSKIISAETELAWLIGNVEVSLFDGTRPEQPPLGHTEIHAYQLQPDGTQQWYQRALSDESGSVRLDLPGVMEGNQYILRVRSPTTGEWKFSSILAKVGRHQFVVGNPPLTVSLIDAQSAARIKAQDIVVYEVLADGAEKRQQKKATDSDGQVTFDLDGLGQGRNYLLKASVFSDTWSKTSIISKPQAMQWKVGTVTLNVVNGGDPLSPPLASYEVQARKLEQDGSLSWYQKGLTDKNGVFRIDLAGLKQAAKYIFFARSLTTGKWKSSIAVSKEGVYPFKVGNRPLIVKLVNGFTNQILPDQAVHAMEVLVDGSFQWREKSITSEGGVAKFDLAGLGDGGSYFLKTKVFHEAWIISDIIDQPMKKTWAVGTLAATILDGTKLDSEPLINHEVNVNEVLPDGRSKWFSRVFSDGQGKVYLDLPKLDTGRRFQLKARSTLSGEWKYSRIIDQVDTLDFVVGNPPLIVKLRDGVTGQPLSQIAVIAMKQLADGSEQWFRRQVSDGNGQLIFELDGLKDGQPYKLKANPFDAGRVASDVIDQPGEYEFRLGTVPVTLIDRATNQALIDQTLVVLRVLADGELSWLRRGKTDKNGKVKFDLEELKSGSSFFIKTKNPFGLGQSYYSARIQTEGSLTMVISKDIASPLDMKSPVVIVTKPGTDQVANAAGFILEGLALDNNEISQIHVSVNDYFRGRSKGVADYNKMTKQWKFSIMRAMITAGHSIDIVVRAQDQSNNVATTKITFPVVMDRYPPSIVFRSHQVDEQVPMTGFTLLGIATDDTGIRDIRASVDDPGLGRTIDRVPLPWDMSTSQWVFSVLNGQISPSANIQITIEAQDAAGLWTTEKLSLKVKKEEAVDAYHVLNRTSFGVTEASLEKIKRLGVGDYLATQLSPENIDDSVLEQQLSDWQPKSKPKVQQYLLYRMAKSERQLLELMTWFWDNHFNTNLNRHGQVAYELSENHLFRKHALGNFKDLLATSAKSPAMLFYLDSIKNNKSEPNENYARELLELHTMGVDGGYQHHDIIALAKIFTGWHVRNNMFYFNDRQHDYSDKIFLGKTIGGVGVEEGERVLEILSSHPATARYICEKLIIFFVDEGMLPSLNQTCMTAFLTHQGHIGEVLKTIFASSEFNDVKYRRNKVKTPLEYVLTSMRNLDIDYNFDELPGVLRTMGMPLLENDIPTGWSEIGEDWISTDLLRQRIQFAFVLNTWIIRDTPQFWLSRLKQKGLFTAEEILGYFNQILFGDKMNKTGWDVALQRLNTSTPINLNEPDDEYRLRELLTLLMTFPGYQYQ